MTQYCRPTALVSAGSWTGSITGLADSGGVSDLDWVESEPVAEGGTSTTYIATGTVPSTNTTLGWVIRLRANKALSGGASLVARLTIQNSTGATTLVEAHNSQDLGSTATEAVFDLTPAEAALVQAAGTVRFVLTVASTSDPLALPALSWFDSFVQDNLTVQAEPLRSTWGGAFAFVSAAAWSYVSENSAAVAFGTTQPATAYLQYGTTTGYGSHTIPYTGRRISRHLHHLTGLTTGQTYHYRVVATDEFGTTLYGADQTITPAAIAGATYINAVPYTCAVSGTYVLTSDVVANARGITIAANNVTIDLNGHTLTYDAGTAMVAPSQPWSTHVYSATSTYGIFGDRTGVVIKNGTVTQAAASTNYGQIGLSFCPIYLRHYANTTSTAEVAGVRVVWHGDSISGVVMHEGQVYVHHCLVDDQVPSSSHTVADRHLGIDAIYSGSGTRAEYNGILRARQNGIRNVVGATGNEIALDSHTINSYGLRPYWSTSAKTISENIILGTGYHVVAGGWAPASTFSHNLVHLLSTQSFSDRDLEYGTSSSMNGFRSTQYDGSSDVLDVFVVDRNVVSITVASACTQARGVQLSADPYFTGQVVSNNLIKVSVSDPENVSAHAHSFSAIAAHGTSTTAVPVRYYDNLVQSNVRLVAFGDDYTVGSKHYLIRTTWARLGAASTWEPIRIGYWTNDSLDHRVLGSLFGSGVSAGDLDDGYFDFTAPASCSYRVGDHGYLRLLGTGAAPLVSTAFTVSDNRGTVLTGTTNTSGVAEVHVISYTMTNGASVGTGTKTTHASTIVTAAGKSASVATLGAQASPVDLQLV